MIKEFEEASEQIKEELNGIDEDIATVRKDQDKSFKFLETIDFSANRERDLSENLIMYNMFRNFIPGKSFSILESFEAKRKQEFASLIEAKNIYNSTQTELELLRVERERALNILTWLESESFHFEKVQNESK